MKNILVIILFFISFAVSAYPIGVKGRSQSVANYPAIIQSPNNQITNIGGGSVLIETGNENMLINPSFEAQTLIGWTCTTGTCTVEKSIALGGGGMFSSGVQSMKVVPTANIFDVSQAITTPANIQSQGSLGVVYNIPATCTTAQIQSKIDGTIQNTISTSNIITDGKFHSIELPIIFGSTSATIRMFSTATCTGNIYVDAAYIKQGLGLTPVTLVETDSLTSNNTSNGSLTDVVTEVQFSSVTASSSNVIDVVQDGGNTRTKFIAKKDCVVNVSYNTSAAISEYVVIYKNGVEASRGSTSYVSTRNIAGSASLSLLAGEYITVGLPSGGSSTAAAYTFTMTAQTIQKSNVYSSANGNYSYKNDGVITITATTTNPTKGTVVTDRILHTRNGDRLQADYQFEQSAGGGAGTGDYLFTLPNGLSFDTSRITPNTTTSAHASVAKAIVGYGEVNDAGNIITSSLLVAYSATKFRVLTTIGASKAFIGSTFINLGATSGYGFHIDAPISGWSNSNAILGSFVGVPNVAGLNTVKLFGANITTTSGAIANNKGGVISSCTAANPTVCTLVGLTNTPICTTTLAPLSNSMIVNISAHSSTSISIETRLSSTTAMDGSRPFNISCWGD